MLGVLSRKERLPSEHLSKNTANRPNVYGLPVVGPRTEHLGCPIPARAHILRHGNIEKFLVRKLHPGQSIVADFQIAVAIYEKISGLQVAVDHFCGMDILCPSENLVQEELTVVI
jgi:hypothetical protein